MPATPQPRIRARLKSLEGLHDAMHFSNVNVRELAELCGSMRHRATIGHLHSGQRDTCSWPLAQKITKQLRMPPHSLFVLEISNPNVGPTQKLARTA